MNKICILAKNQETYFIKRLIEVVGDRLVLVNPWGRQPLDLDFSQVIVRTTGVYGDDQDLDLLEKNFSNAKMINNLYSLRLFRTKETQYQFFSSHQLPALPWFDLRHSDKESVLSFMKQHAHCPRFLVKPNCGQGGWGIEVLSPDQFDQWWSKQLKKNDLSYILQPYVESAEECRVFFIGHDFHLTLKRTPTKGAAANFRQDGQAILVNLPAELKPVITSLIQLTGVSYGAIDFIWYQNQWKILELNVVPGIEQLEQVAKVDVAWELVNRLLTV